MSYNDTSSPEKHILGLNSLNFAINLDFDESMFNLTLATFLTLFDLSSQSTMPAFFCEGFHLGCLCYSQVVQVAQRE